jgi:hypothetical protein
MVAINKDNTPPRAVLLSEPATWQNDNLPHYTVQAMPATGGAGLPVLHEAPCYAVTRCRSTEPCDGTLEFFRSGIGLGRVEAIHVVRQHYTFANWGICRFASHHRADYSADLIFEIDAHVKGVPAYFLDDGYYTPIIETAVVVGRRLYEHLVGNGVDPKYITTVVTRMGSRVTVDWRAFGPRRLWQLIIAVRAIEARVFEAGELASLSADLKSKMILEGERLSREQPDTPPFVGDAVTAEVKVDGSIYSRSDVPRNDPELGNTFRGPFIRPIGALHSGSSPANMWIRATAVPHEKFRAIDATWLTKVSRASAGPSIHGFEDLTLFTRQWRWPEARDPRADHMIEDDPNPSRYLIDLLDGADDLQDELGDDAVDEIKAVRRKSFGSRIRATGELEVTVSEEDAQKIMASLTEVKYQRNGRARSICPFCNKVPVSLTVYSREGHGHCFRCNKTYSLAEIAAKLGLSEAVKYARHSSSPIQRVPVESLPPVPDVVKWGPGTTVVDPEFETLEEAREAQTAFVDHNLERRDDWDLMVLAGPTGLGKTTVAIDMIAKHGIMSRGLFARSEARNPYVSVLAPSRPIDGRRRENCANHARILAARDRMIPEWSVCKRCPFRANCPYLAQFRNIEGVHLGLLHSHARHLDREILNNGSTLTIIDENAWDQCLERIDLTADEIDLFRCDVDWRALLPDQYGTVGLDEALVYLPPTENVGRLIDVLVGFLRGDAVLAAESAATGVSAAAKHGEWSRNGGVADGDLGRLLFARSELAAAVLAVEDRDLERVEARTYDLVSFGGRRPPKRVLAELCQALLELHRDHVREVASASRLSVFRGDDGRWVLRLTRRTQLDVGQAIVLSSTIRPEQVRLAFGERRTVVFAPRVRQRERRTLVADRTYSLSQLTGRQGQALRDRLFETVKELVCTEHRRTGLPVAIIGRSEIINAWNRYMLGADDAKRYAMPWPQGVRDERAEGLRDLSVPRGYISGYAGSVSGSNGFSVELEADLAVDRSAPVTRFVRALVVLGNLIPPLGAVAASVRGAYAGVTADSEVIPNYHGIGPWSVEEPVVVDWTPVYRTIPLQAPDDETVLVSKNVVGFADPRANELLHASYEAELIQIAGRMRGSIPDPVDPTIEPRLFVFAGLGIAEFPFDSVTDLESVRGALGLEIEATKQPKRSAEEQIFWRFKERGPKATILWLAKALRRSHARGSHSPSLLARDVKDRISKAGIPWREKYEAFLIEAVSA